MKVRAKFRCVGNTPLFEGAEIRMYPITGGSEENADFFRHTPAGDIRLSVVTLEVAQRFEVGKTYYVDFEEAPQ